MSIKVTQDEGRARGRKGKRGSCGPDAHVPHECVGMTRKSLGNKERRGCWSFSEGWRSEEFGTVGVRRVPAPPLGHMIQDMSCACVCVYVCMGQWVGEEINSLYLKQLQSM